MSRWIWIVFFVVLIGGAWFYFASTSSIAVDVATVTSGDVRVYIHERAKTRLPHVTRITMPLAGRIQPITFREGDEVAKGTIVAELEADNLDTELAEAQSRIDEFDHLLNSLESVLLSAKAKVKASQAKLEYSDVELDRRKTLEENNAITASIISEAQLLFVESRIEVERDSLLVKAIDAIYSATDIARGEADLTRKRKQRDRDRASLVSPIDGVVLSRRVSNERVLPAGEILMEIGSLNDIQIEAEVLTQDAVSINVGDDVDIEGPGVGPLVVAGTVIQVYPKGFRKISSLGVEQQRVLVIIEFAPGVLDGLRKKGRTLGVDFRSRVKIYTDQKTNALKLPRSALLRDATGNRQVFVVRNGMAELRTVKIGLENDFDVEALEGLSEGDDVILAPESSLEDGVLVEANHLQ